MYGSIDRHIDRSIGRMIDRSVGGLIPQVWVKKLRDEHT